MWKYLRFLILIIFVLPRNAESQVPLKETPEVLEQLFDRLIDNYDDVARLRINDSIHLILNSYAKSDSVFTHRFSNLRYLGQIVSPDSLIKIISWNLVFENKPGRYNCYFIRKQDEGKRNLVYDLTTDYNEKPVRTDTTYTQSDWYGALYYDIKPSVDRKSWLLLGLDYGNSEISRKIIEVLSFKSDGSIVFGKNCFISGEKKSYRAVLEYASNAMMTLRFRSDNSIVFDHLVPISASHKDERQFYGPDYSFDAYNFENGFWRLFINVDVRNQE